MNQQLSPLCTFGVISDVQYADVDDGFSFHKIKRYYRQSLDMVERAVQTWLTESPALPESSASSQISPSESKISFVLQLGDLIDGKARHTPTGSKAALEKALKALLTFPSPMYHTVGNHEVYNFSHQDLLEHFKANCRGLPSESLYYDFSPCKGLRFVCINSYDISLLGHDRTGAAYEKAKEIISVNKNEGTNSSDGLEGVNQRFVGFNGALGDEQLDWLRETLNKCKDSSEKVIIFGHGSILPDHSSNNTLVWNYPEVLEITRSYSCVVAYLHGHDHGQGHITLDDLSGVWHVVAPAVIETDPTAGIDAFLTVSAYEHELHVRGIGKELAVLSFRAC